MCTSATAQSKHFERTGSSERVGNYTKKTKCKRRIKPRRLNERKRLNKMKSPFSVLNHQINKRNRNLGSEGIASPCPPTSCVSMSGWWDSFFLPSFPCDKIQQRLLHLEVQPLVPTPLASRPLWALRVTCCTQETLSWASLFPSCFHKKTQFAELVEAPKNPRSHLVELGASLSDSPAGLSAAFSSFTESPRVRLGGWHVEVPRLLQSFPWKIAPVRISRGFLSELWEGGALIGLHLSKLAHATLKE